MSDHEPLDAAGVEELRRAAEDLDRCRAEFDAEEPRTNGTLRRLRRSRDLQDQAFHRRRHAILASLDLLAKGVEGRATFEHVALAFVPPHKYRATLVTPDRVHGRVLVIPLPMKEAPDGR